MLARINDQGAIIDRPHEADSPPLLPLLPPPSEPPLLTDLLEHLIVDVNTSSRNNTVDNDDDRVEANGGAGVDYMYKQQRLFVLESLLRFEDFSFNQQHKIEEFVTDFDMNLQCDIHEMITDQCATADAYQGLDTNRDTIAEVTTALRLYSNTLALRTYFRWDVVEEEMVYIDEDDEGDYPINCLVSTRSDDTGELFCNVKAIGFIHLFAQLAIEYDLFDDAERGGLLNAGDVYSGGVPLIYLVRSYATNNQDQRTIEDNVCYAEMIKLKQMNLFKREDIMQYCLVPRLCRQYYFAERRFRFLTEWDPVSLLHTQEHNSFGGTPLHIVVSEEGATLQEFRIVLDSLLRYYPKQKGISVLFLKNRDGSTPFSLSCSKFKRHRVMVAIKEVLCRYSITTPIQMTNALLLAATDENIHLDCLNFLLRREPGIVLRSLVPLLQQHRHRDNDDSNSNSNINNNIRNDEGSDDGSSIAPDHDLNADHIKNNDTNSRCGINKMNRKRKRDNG